MTGPWLTLIGIGDDGALPETAAVHLRTAEIVYGSERLFELAGKFNGEARSWPSPFSGVIAEIAALKGTPVAVLATGDPFWFGVGSTLAAHLTPADMRVIPAPSAFQLAAARMSWPLQETDCLSLHGRPIDTLRSALYPGARILALTSDATAPKQIADLLADEGFGETRITVLEHMGGEREQSHAGIAEDWNATVDDFHTLALEVHANHGTQFRTLVPGLPDAAFIHDGKMTKSEVRAVTLSRLRPHPGAVLWDVGAGCGSVGIEWMRAARGALAIGLEPNAGRRQMALENALALGTPGLKILDATAPEGLTDLPAPDAIFIGGGLSDGTIIEVCQAALRDGGRLVANAVTLESEAVLFGAWQRLGGELVRLSVQRASPVGPLTGWRPMMPVTQWSYIKP